MKRISKAKRAFLLAVVRDRVCARCDDAPAFMNTLTCLGCWRKADREEQAWCEELRARMGRAP